MAICANATVVNALQQDVAAELFDRAPRLLARMYDAREKLFVFRLRKTAEGVIREGLSHRYTAISLIGLAEMSDEVQAQALAGDTMQAVYERLESRLAASTNLGDVALTAWAMGAGRYAGITTAWRRLAELKPDVLDCATVELAWALTALSLYGREHHLDLCKRVAGRMVDAYNEHSRLFPHWIGRTQQGLRSHVSCFADLVYPIQALSFFAQARQDPRARAAALGCARQICRLQGDAGQWWWHYDYRTGDVLERYPVYSIHQDAMAPMALMACQDASGVDFTVAIRKGMEWLAASPELAGSSLIADEDDLVWRKVARREPGKWVRYAQAAASGVHSRLRVPVIDRIFPPGSIDYEVRPYHLGWFLYAWTRSKAPIHKGV